MKTLQRYILILSSLCSLALSAGADMVAEEHKSHLIQVRDSDTLELLALSYLGEEALAKELLRANHLTESEWHAQRPPVLWVGPGLREQALLAVSQGAEALEMARTKQAEAFAAFEYKQAEQALRQAVNSLEQGAYEVAFEVALWSANRSRESMAQARSSALTPEEGALASVGKGVNLSYDQGLSWQDVAEGSQIPAGALVKNGSDQALTISLPLNSTLQLQPGGVLFIDTLQIDQRDAHREMLLRLDAGAVEFVAPDDEDTAMEWSLRCGAAHLQGRALTVRCEAENDRVRWTCIKGSGRLYLETEETPLEAKHSVWVDQKGRVDGPYAHPMTPEILKPVMGSSTANQLPLLSWSPVKGSKHYLVKLRQERAEGGKMWDRLIEDNQIRVGPLPGGSYSWEVCAVDPRGLVSEWTPPADFSVRLNYDLEMLVEGRYIEQNGILYSGQQAVYAFRPAAASSSVETMEVQVGEERWRTLKGDPAKLTFSESGEYRFAVRGVGLDGQNGVEAEYRVHIDAEGPRVRVHLSEPLDFPGDGLKSALAVRCDDPAGVKDVQLELDGELHEGPSDFLLLNMSRRHRIDVTVRDAWDNVTTREIRTYPDGRVKIKD